MLYSYEVEKCSNFYAYQIGICGSYDHGFKTLKLFFFNDGCIVRGGVRGGTSGAMYCRCNIGGDYNDDIPQGMNYWR